MLKRSYYFVFLLPEGTPLNTRLPDGGLSVPDGGLSVPMDEVERLAAAYELAESRFPRRPWELLVVVEQWRRRRRRQAWLMERDWLRRQRTFEELMA